MKKNPVDKYKAVHMRWRQDWANYSACRDLLGRLAEQEVLAAKRNDRAYKGLTPAEKTEVRKWLHTLP